MEITLKQEITELLESTKREGIKNLIKDLSERGFFESPASTRFHGAYDGGLLEHSHNVYILFNRFVRELRQDIKINKDSVILCSLLHDVCKAGMYIKDGDKYLFNQQFRGKGHARLSLEIIEKHIYLNLQEKNIILFHMGYYGTTGFNQRGEYSLMDLAEANKEPLTKLFYWCDDMSSQFID